MRPVGWCAPGTARAGRARWRGAVSGLCLGLGILVVGVPVRAGRPLATEDTATLAPGQVELELGLEHVREHEATSDALPVAALNVGIAPRLQATVGNAVVLLDPHAEAARAGLGDTGLRLKYGAVGEGAVGPALAAVVNLRLPTGDEARGLGSAGVDVQALAVASKALGPLTLNANAGYTFVTHVRGLDVVSLGAAALLEVAPTWLVVGEIVSDLATGRGGEDRAVARLGAVHALTASVSLDAAAAVALMRASPDLLLTVGVTLRLR